MGVTATTRWTCDRCGAIRDFVDTPQGQPDDWGAIDETTPPKASSEKQERLGVLCFSCRGELREWWSRT